MVSFPAPPRRTSTPAPPERVSLPSPPSTVSFPDRPETTSLPAPAVTTSRPDEPVMAVVLCAADDGEAVALGAEVDRHPGGRQCRRDDLDIDQVRIRRCVQRGRGRGKRQRVGLRTAVDRVRRRRSRRWCPRPAPALITSAAVEPVMVSPWALPMMVKPSLWAPRLIVTPAAASAAVTISTLISAGIRRRVQRRRGRRKRQRVRLRTAVHRVAGRADDGADPIDRVAPAP